MLRSIIFFPSALPRVAALMVKVALNYSGNPLKQRSRSQIDTRNKRALLSRRSTIDQN